MPALPQDPLDAIRHPAPAAEQQHLEFPALEFLRGALVFRHAQLKVAPEASALAGLCHDAELPLHSLHQPSAEGELQSALGRAPGQRSVLGEGIEEAVRDAGVEVCAVGVDLEADDR